MHDGLSLRVALVWYRAIYFAADVGRWGHAAIGAAARNAFDAEGFTELYVPVSAYFAERTAGRAWARVMM